MNGASADTSRAALLEPRVLRVRAGNPGPLTGTGTNSYVVRPEGTDDVAVIDPGPAEDGHLAALLDAIGHAHVAGILLTHPHLDHSAGAGALARATGAPVAAYGPARSGRSAVMEALVARLDTMPGRAVALLGGGEGCDDAFDPDIRLSDGDSFAGLAAIWTPGHLGSHLAFRLGDAVFTGDVAMGWASSLISPPDGDMGQYMASLDRLHAEGARILHPGHGDPIGDPAARLDALKTHRLAREASVLAALASGPSNIGTLVARVYADVDPSLHTAAARNVLAHLLDLYSRGSVAADPHPAPDAVFGLA